MVFTDSDHAGCLRTRKSTSNLFYGSLMQRSTSTTQGVIASGSGESEFHALVKGTSAGLAAVSMLEDLGVDISKSTNNDRAVTPCVVLVERSSTGTEQFIAKCVYAKLGVKTWRMLWCSLTQITQVA